MRGPSDTRTDRTRVLAIYFKLYTYKYIYIYIYIGTI